MQQDDKRPQQPAEQGQTVGGQPTRTMSPGDQAPPGTPGTGESLCEVCGGEGTVEGQQCVNCGGTGVVITGVGGS